MKVLPSQFFFSKDTETEFQRQLNANSRRFATIALYLAVVLMSSFIVMSALENTFFESLWVNVLRLSMIALSIALIIHCNQEKTQHLASHFFYYALLFCTLNCFLFWSIAKDSDQLNEGGPMLLVAALVAIPMLHLGHKLALWLIIGLGLFCIQLFLPVDIFWSIFFYFSMVFVMGGIQYQLDLLLRTQYKAELIEAEKAKTDQLTGLYNRYSFDTKLKNLIAQLKPDQSIALAMIDIDYFKKYNDNYGHLEGDRILVAIAKILSNLKADMVVRFGGEEFILVKVLSDSNEQWLNDLPVQLKKTALVHAFSPFGYITVSVGVAKGTNVSNTLSPKMLLTTADSAMYKAKHSGRNTILYVNT